MKILDEIIFKTLLHFRTLYELILDFPAFYLFDFASACRLRGHFIITLYLYK